MQSRFPLTEADSVLQKTPFSFDASVWEFYAPLLVGARLVIAKPGGHQDSEYLIKTIEEHEVTILQLVPSLLQQLLESNEIERCRNLKRVFCGGEELPSSLAQLFFIHLDADLCNLYGPTEATIDTTFWMCKVEERDHQKVPIGHPIDNVQVYVLDDYLQPVPIGVSGELYVGGAGLAKGYLNQPTLTAERFIFHPLHDDMRLYKTGDLARYRADGALEFLGRRDFQVKVRGFRIELGEIENVLCQHPAVQKAVVVVREDIANDKRLVAYVVLRVEHVVQRKEIQHYLSQQLPMYMVPSTVMLLEGLPITPNGKVDRHALPLPDSTKGTFSDNFVAPTLTTHYQLVQIWEELLDVRPIGIKDNFFDLGGHSLLAARMANKIEQVCGKKFLLPRFLLMPQ